MINSIPKIESDKVYTFGQFTTQKTPSAYWLPAPVEESPEISNKKKKKKGNEDEFTSSKIRIITPSEAQKTDNPKLIGWSIAGATVLTAAGLFLLLKGGTKGLSKNFQKLRDYFDKKLQNSKLNSNDGLSFSNRLYIYIVKSLDIALKRKEAINNFTTFKDMLFKKIMYLNKYTTKVHDSISRMFEKIGRQSVLNTYKTTAGKARETQLLTRAASEKLMQGNTYEVIEINGIRQTKAQWLAQLDEMHNQLHESYDKNFSHKALTKRYLQVKKSLEYLKSVFAKMKIFFSKDVYSTFIAEEKIAKEKAILQKVVRAHRLDLSYSLADMAKESDDTIMKMTELISFKDADKIKYLRDIRGNIKKYVKNPEANAELKEQITASIEKFLKNVKDAQADKVLDENTARKLLSGAEDLKTTFAGFKQGKIQDILDIYKKLLPADEYSQIAKSYRESIKSLDKSIHIETEDFVSKLRDLILGSAPTDILTILGSFGVLGYYLGKSENNDQRTSIAIKYGFPALAGIGVSLYCNAKLFAGTKSLIIGTLSTWVLNRIGIVADDALKKHKNSKKSQVIAEAAVVKNPPKNV